MEIKIDDETEAIFQERAKHSEYESAAEYAAMVLEVVAEELADEETPNEEMRDRLSDLGYL
ncbi:hypothetical protein SAMN05192561_102139 [Halopenitus malekzadehii]|uniref:CopG family transcriptional regulator n=1 Tax=Halopenitus malekzadehii TaxID=1267564 RepID=A0A1H6ID40_9EURY|nr:hypothetical protein [Halopenitus malekzadehii]SEH46284.1 hypothetical protein SAMN05192561_102139 [Halopenitus malekzadehii]